MATGCGKTFTSISFIYRLIKFAGGRRIHHRPRATGALRYPPGHGR
jgi:hypothetical protein